MLELPWSIFQWLLKKIEFLLLYQGWDFGDGEPPAGDSPCGSLVDSGHVDSAPVGASHRLQTGDHPLTLVALVLEETHQPVACCGSGSRLQVRVENYRILNPHFGHFQTSTVIIRLNQSLQSGKGSD